MKGLIDFFKSKWKHILIVAIALILVVVLAIVLGINHILNQANYDDHYVKSSQNADIIHDSSVPTNDLAEDDLVEDKIHVIEGPSTKDSIKEWCSMGNVVSSDDVINILLIGMDNENMYTNSRADAMMIASINKKTKKITLASVLRDQYAYVNSSKPRFEKMHHALARGGPQLQISVIEAHLKVRIDNYILVNFTSFKKIVDMLDGITVNLTSAEAKLVGVPAGRQHLNGEQVLKYTRIRFIDSDVVRTSRQQTIIEAIIERAKTASLTELTAVITELLGYVRTGMNKGEILGLAAEAVASGWFNYELVNYVAPGADYRKGGYIGRLWYWTVNYPKAAQELQLRLYDRTNIIIE